MSIYRLKVLIKEFEKNIQFTTPEMNTRLNKLAEDFKSMGYILTKATYSAMGHQIVDTLIYSQEHKRGAFSYKAAIVVNRKKAANLDFAQEIETDSLCIINSEILDYVLNIVFPVPRNILDLSGDIHSFTSGPYRLYPSLIEYSNTSDPFQIEQRNDYKVAKKAFDSWLKLYGFEKLKYVCIHMRAEGYKSDTSHQHEYTNRNTPIEDLQKTINYLEDNGLPVIRVGDIHMPEIKHRNVLDFANMQVKLPYIDYFLNKYSLFNLYDSSGAGFISVLTGKRTYLYNLHPPMMIGWGDNDICIFQKLFWRQTREYLTLSEIFREGGPASTCSVARWKEKGIDVHRNDEDEILELCMLALYIEQHGFRKGIIEKIRLNKLNIKIKSLIPKDAFNCGVNASVSPTFLKRIENCLR